MSNIVRFKLATMKLLVRPIILAISVGLFLNHMAFAQEAVSQTDGEIIHWLQQKGMRVEHIEAEHGFADLQPLKQILKDVKVVGLGENTHGTKEFFQVKHRLLEFLVKEMGFQAFAIEAPYVGCVPINDYILFGKGDRETVLSGQNYVVWDTEEMAAMIDWMRNYNQYVPISKKVRFYGLDYFYNEVGAKSVLAYLQKHDMAKVSEIKLLFQSLAEIEKEKGMTRMDEVQDELKETLPQLQKLIDFLTKNEKRFIAASNTREFKKTLIYTRVMQQLFHNNIKDSIPKSVTPNMARSRSMANNLFHIMDMEESIEKVVVWEHNSHVSVGEPETGEPNMGYDLRNKFGDAYYAIGFEFNKGSYQSRTLSSDKILGDLKTNTVNSAPVGYMAWYLSRTMKGNSIINLRTPASNVRVKDWLDSPQTFRRFSWISHVTSEQQVIPSVRYDGILFIENTTASRPTSNALKTVSRGEGL